ncbi:hypothetical protein MTO96_047891 [Rhipicephalus appendiculatus]
MRMIIHRFLVVNHRGILNGTWVCTHLKAPTAHGCGEIRRSCDEMRAANRVGREIDAPRVNGATRRSQAAASGGDDNIPGANTQGQPRVLSEETGRASRERLLSEAITRRE